MQGIDKCDIITQYHENLCLHGGLNFRKDEEQMAKEKKVEQITDMEVDFAQWYTDVCRKAELIDYSSCLLYTSSCTAPPLTKPSATSTAPVSN